MTTQTFADYVATQDARNTIQLNVRKWTEMLCEALEQNFVEESIKRAKFFAVNNGSHDEEYYEKRIAEIKEGKDCYKFEIETGRKYHKIVQTDRSGSRSVHAFVDRKLVKSTRQHHSRHLPSTFASTSASSLIVSGCWRTLTGQVDTSISVERRL